jgi:hypothetical protein
MALVRILKGIFTRLDSIAVNDFETILVGAVTDLRTGMNATGDCGWGTTQFTSRF